MLCAMPQRLNEGIVKFRLLIILLLIATGTSSMLPGGNHHSHFNILMRYGLGYNELDTFDSTFSTEGDRNQAFIIPMILSDKELTRIENRLREIRFFEYPDTLLTGDKHHLICVQPAPSYYFRVQSDSQIKTVFYDQGRGDPRDPRAIALRDLVDYILKIIGSRKEYKALPRRSGPWQ